jgi:hypothetical protein
LGNARTIQEIETIIGRSRPGLDQLRWEASGAECNRGRHVFSSAGYSLTVEVTSIARLRPKPSWRLILVTELWRSGDMDLRSTKWLKVLQGRAADVISWLSTCREKVATHHR